MHALTASVAEISRVVAHAKLGAHLSYPKKDPGESRRAQELMEMVIGPEAFHRYTVWMNRGTS